MRKNILVTGKPKSGKSTLLRKLISDIPNKVGLITNEILKDHERVGFEMETNKGHKAILAHIDFKTPYQVSKYFVNTESLESIIPLVAGFENDNFLYLDEIGQMQLFSERFKNLILQYLNSNNIFLGSVSFVFEDDFVKSIKKRNDVILIEISPENRGDKEIFLKQFIKKLEKARKYVSEPDRLTTNGLSAELRSESATRRLILETGGWCCDCDFFDRYDICSHAIAVEELTGLEKPSL